MRSLCAVLLCSPALAQHAIVNSLDSGTDAIAFIGDAIIEDYRVPRGGLLESLGFAMTAQGAGDPVVSDLTVIVALDGGDGLPDVDGTGDDSFLFNIFLPGVAIDRGGVTEITLDVRDFWALVPDDALIFAGVIASSPEVGHVFFGEPTVGTTDDFVFSFLHMGPVPAPSVSDPSLLFSHAAGLAIVGDDLPPRVQRGHIDGPLIDFEDLDEGFQGTDLTTHGVRFHGARDGFPPPSDAMLAIDDGTGVWAQNPDMLDFVEGKLLQLNTFSSGPDGYAFSNLKSLRIDPQGVFTGVTMNCAYVVEIIGDTDFRSATITLLARRNGTPVASDQIHPDTVLGQSGGGSFTFGAGTLTIAGVEFDELVLFCNGPGLFGSVQLGLDRVRIGTAVCQADLDRDDDVDADDFFLYLDLFASENAGADIDLDGDLDGDDFFAYLDLFLLGC